MSKTSEILTQAMVKTASLKKEAKFRLADDKTLTKLCQSFSRRSRK